MPNIDNKTLIYPHQQVGLKPDGVAGAYNTLFGVQEVGLSANFNLQQFFELGQISIYSNKEDLPDVEWTLNKISDGSPLLYHEATKGASAGPTLINRSTSKSILGMSFFPDTNQSAAGTPGSVVESSGLFYTSLNYTFGVNGAFTESITLVGNDIISKGDEYIVNTDDLARANALNYAGNAAFANNNDTPASGFIQDRVNIKFDFNPNSGVDVNGQVADPDATILPREIFGITSSGTNEEYNGAYNASIQSITISTNLNRENVNELGRRGPYYKRPSLPVDVTCAIEVMSKSGIMLTATEHGKLGNTGSCGSRANLEDQTIRIATCFNERFYLGTKNRLTGFTYGGGGTDGTPATMTYNYTTKNDLTIIAHSDPNSNGSTWWANRGSYLVN